MQKLREQIVSVPAAAHQIVSPVSPDEQTVLVTAPRPSFLNLHDGSSVPLKADPGLLQLSNYFWLNGDTVGQYMIDLSLNLYLITGDRRSGASEVIPSDSAGTYPILVPPDGRRALYAFAGNKLITLDFGSGQVQTLRAADGDGGAAAAGSDGGVRPRLAVLQRRPGAHAAAGLPRHRRLRPRHRTYLLGQ
ncbi:MAG: hypothetical protein HGA45_35150 [Chloroflexales bacterium]|nr:hypothetical protein [Chloroflexales bacterium]